MKSPRRGAAVEAECNAVARDLDEAVRSLAGLLRAIRTFRRRAANAIAVLAWLDRPTEAQMQHAEAEAAAARAEADAAERTVPAARNAVTRATRRLEEVLQRVTHQRTTAEAQAASFRQREDAGSYGVLLVGADADWKEEARTLEEWERSLGAARDHARREVASAERAFSQEPVTGGPALGPGGRRLSGPDTIAPRPGTRETSPLPGGGLRAPSWLTPSRGRR